MCFTTEEEWVEHLLKRNKAGHMFCCCHPPKDFNLEETLARMEEDLEIREKLLKIINE